MPETFWTPELVGHFFAGVQFMLGDLAADATPNPASSDSSGGAALSAVASAKAAAPPAAAQAAPPPVPSISQRPNGGEPRHDSRRRRRTTTSGSAGASAMPTAALKGLTFSDALAKADVYRVSATVEASSAADGQRRESRSRSTIGCSQASGTAVVYRLRELNQQMLAYRVDNLGVDEATRRQVFEFAKAINAPLIVTQRQRRRSAGARQRSPRNSRINVALESKTDPKALVSALEGRSKRLGIAADLGGVDAGRASSRSTRCPSSRTGCWSCASIEARSASDARADWRGRGRWRLLSRRLSSGRQAAVDRRSSRPADDRSRHGEGPDRLRTRDVAGDGRARARDARVAGRQDSRPRPARRRTCAPQIDAAAPRQAIVKPKKPRKLLVTDIQMYSGHSTIPHGNLSARADRQVHRRVRADLQQRSRIC